MPCQQPKGPNQPILNDFKEQYYKSAWPLRGFYLSSCWLVVGSWSSRQVEHVTGSRRIDSRRVVYW